MTDRTDFSVRFWGVRGSIACPGPEYIRYGGNTSCLEIRCGGRLLIFDGGTGIRSLGVELAKNGAVDADIFLTHTHLDHIIGLPFFAPLYVKDNAIRFWGGHLNKVMTLRDALSEMMTPPIFPVPLEIFNCQTGFHDFSAGETLTPMAGVVLRTAPLNHPNGATGYRIEFNGHAICFVTDCEHRKDGLDETVLNLIRGADLFIYDASYSDLEYRDRAGWGHSTWEQALRLAEAGNVGRAVLFHHDPSHTDVMMDEIAAAAEKTRPGTIVAREGMVLSL